MPWRIASRIILLDSDLYRHRGEKEAGNARETGLTCHLLLTDRRPLFNQKVTTALEKQ
jgi:hypothetical protein